MLVAKQEPIFPELGWSLELKVDLSALTILLKTEMHNGVLVCKGECVKPKDEVKLWTSN